jgi:serine protease Do
LQKRYSLAALMGAAAASFILATAMRSHPPLSEAAASAAAGFETRLATFAAIARRTMPVVVNIATTAQRSVRGGSSDPIDEFFNRFFGEMPPRKNRQRSLGSGILISRESEILTSYHVVKNAVAIKVRLADHSEYEARLVGEDEKTDLALIKIRKANPTFSFARLGNSSQLNVGDWVMAIGNPFGLERTVTASMVSAKGRVIGAGAEI